MASAFSVSFPVSSYAYHSDPRKKPLHQRQRPAAQLRLRAFLPFFLPSGRFPSLSAGPFRLSGIEHQAQRPYLQFEPQSGGGVLRQRAQSHQAEERSQRQKHRAQDQDCFHPALRLLLGLCHLPGRLKQLLLGDLLCPLRGLGGLKPLHRRLHLQGKLSVLRGGVGQLGQLIQIG